MIRKILAIKNVGRFENCTWRGGAQFESIAMIYAENGRGKSTFCDILRSFQTGVPDFILGRKRLGSTEQSEVVILSDGGVKSSFQNQRWDATDQHLAIFDTTFVHQNVFAGDRVDHEHKKNLYRVIVGEVGVKLAQKVDKLDADIRDVTREIQVNQNTLAALLPSNTNLGTFAELKPDADIANKIALKNEELKIAESAEKKAAEIKAKSFLHEIALPTLPSDLESTLSTQLSSFSADAEKELRLHIAEHTKGASEAWLSQGLLFQKDDQCPFCGQSTSDLPLIASFRAFFDAAYDRFKRKLAELEQMISSQFSGKVALDIQKTSGENATLLEFWRELGVGKTLDVPDISTAADVIGEVREAAGQLVKTKASAPVSAIQLSDEFKRANASFGATQEKMADYNKAIRECNALITDFKAKQSATEVTKLKGEVAALKLIELRDSEGIKVALDLYNKSRDKKEVLTKEKDTAKADLDKYGETVLATHETRINELLKMFAAGFRIGQTERSYIGGKPSSSFKLLINDVPVDLGDERTPISVPSFRNTLSAGDKSTLALALFFAQLESDPNLNEKIVVFDDPLTSQDRSRRTATQTLICNCAKKVTQVFVLSHDPHFLRGVWDGYKGGGAIQSFQFLRMGKGTSIGEWDVIKETTGEYAKKHRILWDYVHNSINSTASPREVAQMIRPVLEEYLRLKLPHSFADNEWLGNFIDKIRKAAPTDPVAAAQCILSRLEMINEYSKRYHHSTNPGYASEIIDDAELMTYVEETLDVVGGF